MLSVQTVLVVEEEFLIALDIQRMLEARNVKQTVFARSPQEALAQQASWGQLGLAIVEVRTTGGDCVTLCQHLTANDVPLIITTGDAALRSGIPSLAGVPVLVKPISDTDLASAL